MGNPSILDYASQSLQTYTRMLGPERAKVSRGSIIPEPLALSREQTLKWLGHERVPLG